MFILVAWSSKDPILSKTYNVVVVVVVEVGSAGASDESFS